MDRKSVENAINIFTGDYNESLNASKLQKLQLTSTCNGRWNIKNPNDSSVSFHWSAYKTERDTDDENDKDHDTDEDKMPQTSEFSDGVVPAKSEASFNTLTGKSQLRVFVNKKQHATRVAKKAVCTTPLYTFTWSANSRSVSVKPVTPLQVGVKYTAVMSTNARNADGSRSVKVPVNYSFVVAGREYATVRPGGSATFSSGVKISVSQDARDTPLEMFSEEVPASAAKLPISSSYVAISPYYRIGTTGDDTSSRGFEVAFPIPSGEENSNLGVIFLDPEMEGEVDYNWATTIGARSVNGMPVTTPHGFFREGSIYVLVKTSDEPLPSAPGNFSTRTIGGSFSG